MSNLNVEARLDRLENLFSSAGEMMLRTVELSQQNFQQIERNSQQIERNSQQIERNSQQIELNSQQLMRLESTMAQLALQAATDRAEFEEFRRTTRAALEKIDRVLDYLMQRDDKSPE